MTAKKLMNKKCKIEICKNNMSNEIIHTFNSVNELEKFLKKTPNHNIMGDQLVVNDCLLYGWDELFDFI